MGGGGKSDPVLEKGINNMTGETVHTEGENGASGPLYFVGTTECVQNGRKIAKCLCGDGSFGKGSGRTVLFPFSSWFVVEAGMSLLAAGED